ncbi:MAG TPA: hypothetical protein VNY73_09290 [Bacteroidia bacterium]|jgi:hypothetical protein|nr:hypothetical protein [Bacteroidia bacterium]
MKDLSKKILELYYDQEKPLEIIMMDGSVLIGKLVAFFHDGDEDQITGWHFVDKDDVKKYEELLALDGGSEYGKIIKQKDIKNIRFK